jgi:hypothetical protein
MGNRNSSELPCEKGISNLKSRGGYSLEQFVCPRHKVEAYTLCPK